MAYIQPDKNARLWEVAGLFLKMGFTAFGGPAAHIAMFHDEVVRRRKWVDDQEFLDMLGATNLIPGPNSTEMVIHIGYVRAGWPGLIVAGSAFILPAMLIVILLAWIFTRYGSTPQAAWLLYGIKPVIIAIIAQAFWGLGRKAIKGRLTALVGIVALVLSFLNVNEVYLLFGGGLIVMAIENLHRSEKIELKALLLPLSGLAVPGLAAAPFSLSLMFLIFLKIGAILYGSGYVLLAFLRADLVTRLGWLTDQQLVDAIAIGQVTPGPLFTTATFIGYQLGGLSGALLATLGIFLPSFVFVAISNPFIPRLRNSPWASGFLDGINVSALGLMAAVTWQIGAASLTDLYTFCLAVAAGFVLFRYKINATWLILAGAALGLLSSLWR
jgi:chromate transporter